MFDTQEDTDQSTVVLHTHLRKSLSIIIAVLVCVAGLTVFSIIHGQGSAGKGISAIYYSPFSVDTNGNGDFIPSHPINVKAISSDDWETKGLFNRPVDCTESNTEDRVKKSYEATNKVMENGSVTTIAGWSVGRVGVLYTLFSIYSHQSYVKNLNQDKQLNYILLIDPGNYSELHDGCDNSDLIRGGSLLSSWLTRNPSARLVILSGDETTDLQNTSSNAEHGGHANAGIQNIYFNDIRAANEKYPSLDINSRVLVCNYTWKYFDPTDSHGENKSHDHIITSAYKYIGQPPLTSCPSDLHDFTLGYSWHPSSAPVAPPTSTPVVPPTSTPVVPPTNVPIAPPTNVPVVPPTNVPVAPPTNVPVAPPTNTPIPPPTYTPIPSQPTYPETSGGAAHTWTNYMNAGGYEGQLINAFQTVQMACRLTGHSVADSNTWWYRIAQSPWSNAYYVSADAFYNNGATSGPLKGTPYVDTNVPLC